MTTHAVSVKPRPDVDPKIICKVHLPKPGACSISPLLRFGHGFRLVEILTGAEPASGVVFRRTKSAGCSSWRASG